MRKSEPLEQTVGAFEAKTNLSRYLADAQRGIVTVVTVRGRPAAKIVPASSQVPDRRHLVEELLDRGREIRSRTKRGPESMHDLINSGRR